MPEEVNNVAEVNAKLTAVAEAAQVTATSLVSQEANDREQAVSHMLETVTQLVAADRAEVDAEIAAMESRLAAIENSGGGGTVATDRGMLVRADKLVTGLKFDGSDQKDNMQLALQRGFGEGVIVGIPGKGAVGTSRPLTFDGQGIEGVSKEASKIIQLDANNVAWDGKGVLTHRSFMDGTATAAFVLKNLGIQGGKGKYGNGVCGAETESGYSHVICSDFGPVNAAPASDLNGHGFFPNVGARTATAPAMWFEWLRTARCTGTAFKLDVGQAQLTDWRLRSVISAGQGPVDANGVPFAPYDFDFGGAGGATIMHLKGNGRSKGAFCRIRGFLETTVYDLHPDGWALGGSGAALQLDEPRGGEGAQFTLVGGTLQFRKKGPNVMPLFINPAIPATVPITIGLLNCVQWDATCGKVRVPNHAELIGAFTNYGPGVQRG